VKLRNNKSHTSIANTVNYRAIIARRHSKRLCIVYFSLFDKIDCSECINCSRRYTLALKTDQRCWFQHVFATYVDQQYQCDGSADPTINGLAKQHRDAGRDVAVLSIDSDLHTRLRFATLTSSSGCLQASSHQHFTSRLNIN
jgi:hypothetical protein